MARHSRLRAAALIATVALVAACSSAPADPGGTGGGDGDPTGSASGSSSPSAADPGADAAGSADLVTDGTFTIAQYGDLGTLNPMLNVSSAVREVTPYAYDRLLYLDADGEPHGWLAESWQADLTSVTYTLKDGITCSDGTALTASTVAANFEFIDDEDNASPLRGAVIPAGLSTEADDDARTVTITFDEPGSFLLSQTGTLDILCQAALDDPTSIDNASNGTGIYTITDALPGDTYTFQRRDGYAWSFDDTTSDTPGLPKTVVVKIVSNQSTVANMLLAGEINAGRVGGPDIDRVEGSGLDKIGSDTLTGQFWFAESEGHPTADQGVRSALLAALDINALAQVYTGGRGSVATSMLSYQPRPCTYTTVPEPAPADPDRAAQLLDEAGWPAGDDGRRAKDGSPLSITLLYDNTQDGYKAAAELAQSTWDALGIAVTLDGGDDAYVIDRALSGDPAAFDVTWVALQTDLPPVASPFVSGPVPPDGVNMTGAEHQDYAALAATAGELSGADSCDAWRAAEQTLIDGVHTLPFAQTPNSIYLTGATLTAPAPSPLGPTLRLTK